MVTSTAQLPPAKRIRFVALGLIATLMVGCGGGEAAAPAELEPPELPAGPDPLIALTLNGGLVGYTDRLAVAEDGTAVYVADPDSEERIEVGPAQMRRLEDATAGLDAAALGGGEPCEPIEGADALTEVFEIGGVRVGCTYDDERVAERVERARAIATEIIDELRA